jgi:hypothetical protein
MEVVWWFLVDFQEVKYKKGRVSPTLLWGKI